MILNQRQFRITKAAEARVAKQLEELSSAPSKGLTSRQRALLLEAGSGQLEDLRRELQEYEALRMGAIPIAPIGSIEELPLALIRARIARGWTQARLAEELGVPEQQVQRDEANAYRGASIERVRRTGDVLGVRLTGAAQVSAAEPTLESSPRWRKPLLLMLLDAVDRIHHRTIGGRLELQKLVLVLEGELRSQIGWSAFRFEPYLLGGYDLEIDDDLDFLVRHGFAAVEVSRSQGRADPAADHKESTRIVPGAKAATWLSGFLESRQLATPAEKRQVVAIVDDVARRYGQVGARGLLEHTYERHKELSTRSVIREDVERRIARKRKRM